jgi:inner membrane protein
MDNLTHSLVGALLGQMGLKRKTGLAMPTLIIAANLPDIDAVAVLLGGHQHLAIRRGITHGPIAMVFLPLVLWGAMLWFDRWQTRRGTRPEMRLPVNAKWLLGLAYIGCLSHPLFDWFNSYGIRLLEPFSSRWFYGDTLFIIDFWIWVALGAGLWLSIRRERRQDSSWRLPAFVAAVFLVAYIGANISISAHLVRKFTREQVSQAPQNIIANPVPLAFWKREMLWQSAVGFGSMRTFRTVLLTYPASQPKPFLISRLMSCKQSCDNDLATLTPSCSGPGCHMRDMRQPIVRAEPIAGHLRCSGMPDFPIPLSRTDSQ